MLRDGMLKTEDTTISAGLWGSGLLHCETVGETKTPVWALMVQALFNP